MQPTIGILSDNTTSRLGRRRPYLIGGVAFIVIGEILVANAQVFGVALGDPDKVRHPLKNSLDNYFIFSKLIFLIIFVAFLISD